jgi:hypothetical protein
MEKIKMSAKQVAYKGPVCKERKDYESFIIKMDQYARDNDVFDFMQSIKHEDLPETEIDAYEDGIEKAVKDKIRKALNKN